MLAAEALTPEAGVTLAATAQEKAPEPAKAPAVSKSCEVKWRPWNPRRKL